MYYITYSLHYPIYEPAEGGYYYAGKENVWIEQFSTFRKAKLRMRKLLKEYRLTEEVNIISFNNQFFGYNGRRIGEGWCIELTRDKLPEEHGYVPYC